MKKPLLLLPGWGMNTWSWGSWRESLSSEYHCFELDWEGVTSREAFAARVAEQVRLINSEQLVIIAWSLGSLAAMEAISKYQLSPKQLILVGGTACFTAREGYRAGWSSRVLQKMQARLRLHPAEVLAEFRGNLFSASEVVAGWAEQFEGLVKQHRAEFKLPELVAGLDYLADSDWRALLSDLQLPVLIIHGTADRIVPVSAAEYLQAKLPNSILKLVSTGHLPFFTASAEFSLMIKEFLDEA